MLHAGFEDLYWRVLTLEEARMLAVLSDVIVPPDDYAGASQAGVVQFLDRQLAGYYRRYQPLYRGGLAALEAASRKMFHTTIIDLSAADRVALVIQWERNSLPTNGGEEVPMREFFDRFVDHVMQGYYGAPRHGGNRDAVSWRMLGLPQPPVRSRRPANPIQARKPL
jgi:gluconate 2-dehydrogenase gamma chain